VLAVALLLAGAASAAEAADADYPSRPIRLIVPFAPGGPSDVLSRFVAQRLGENLAGTIVVDNRGSVGGILGAELAAKSNPDGYTLLLSANSLLSINPHVYKKLPYNPERDLQPITQLTEGGNVVVVHPSIPAASIGEFIAYAMSKPGQINYATTGTGNLLGIADFKVRAGIDMAPIAYKGTGQALVALLSGEVKFFFMSPLVAITHVKAGKLRALAVTSLTRNPARPEVATVAESGIEKFQNITWHSVLAPAKTPQPIVKRLNGELVKIVRSPDAQARFRDQGLTAVGSTPEEMGKHIREESAEVAALVKKIGYQPQ
jgi:tripartite-type tricarboxylate transporter receptor subunit TctC